METLAEFYKNLLQLEISEAKFKFSRLLRFHKQPQTQLTIGEVEGSLYTLSSNSNEAFSSFNVARVQNTSPEGILDILRVFSAHKQKHILVTVPLGISDAGYLELTKRGYGMFHSRSVLGLRQASGQDPLSFAGNIETKDTSEHFASALGVLNSFYPTSQDEFDASYTYWLSQNDNAKLFIALENDNAVGMGILSWQGANGILSSGVVSPESRGRGIQKALIGRRIQEAHRLGIRSLYAPGVPPFSASEASLRSCGFELICNRSIWKKI